MLNFYYNLSLVINFEISPLQCVIITLIRFYYSDMVKERTQELSNNDRLCTFYKGQYFRGYNKIREQQEEQQKRKQG